MAKQTIHQMIMNDGRNQRIWSIPEEGRLMRLQIDGARLRVSFEEGEGLPAEAPSDSRRAVIAQGGTCCGSKPPISPVPSGCDGAVTDAAAGACPIPRVSHEDRGGRIPHVGRSSVGTAREWWDSLVWARRMGAVHRHPELAGLSLAGSSVQ
jgi:hypothetical protein